MGSTRAKRDVLMEEHKQRIIALRQDRVKLKVIVAALNKAGVEISIRQLTDYMSKWGAKIQTPALTAEEVEAVLPLARTSKKHAAIADTLAKDYGVAVSARQVRRVRQLHKKDMPTQEARFNYHLDLATGKYTCDLCESAYAYKGSMVRHSRSHDPSNAVTCDICSRTFNRAGGLQRHKLIHEAQEASRQGQTLNACDTCQKDRIRCDGQSPCGRCVRRNVSCLYGDITIVRRLPQVAPSDQSESIEYTARDRPQDRRQATAHVYTGHRESIVPAASNLGPPKLPMLFEESLLRDGAPQTEAVNSTGASAAERNGLFEVPSGEDDSEADQGILAAALLSHHLARLRSFAPMTHFSKIPIDNSSVRQSEESLIGEAERWALDPKNQIAVAHACSVYEVAHEATLRIQQWPQSLRCLAQMALYDAAVILWIYAGMHASNGKRKGSSRHRSFFLKRSKTDRPSLKICKENACEVQVEIGTLCKKINGNESGEPSKSVWAMAVNPFAELCQLQNRAV